MICFIAQTHCFIIINSLRTETGAPFTDDSSPSACLDASIKDGGADYTINNPGADFVAATPDGKYLMLSLRGPAPVSATHSAQGSCPGVGIVELKDGGASGALVGVLRATNEIEDTMGVITPPGGLPYSGLERSDVHDVVVVKKAEVDETKINPKPGEGDELPSAAIIGKTSHAVVAIATMMLCLVVSL